MTADRLERALPDLLLDLYLQPELPYRDDIVRRTAGTRQRPAWTFPGRWLPMADIASERVRVPGLPWRTLGVALVLLALLVGTIVVVGAMPHRLPAPFGPAANGLIAFEQGGDIYVGDPVSGKTTAIVTGSATDTEPRWSLDGTKIAFARKTEAGGTSQLFVVGPTGDGLRLVTTNEFLTLDSYAFSPDGTEILISGSPRMSAGIDSTDPGMFIAKTDGTAFHQVDVGMIAVDPSYRAPLGDEIAFVGTRYVGDRDAIYAVHPDGTGLRLIVPANPVGSMNRPQFSPDGTLMTYNAWHDANENTARMHVMHSDGTNDIVVDSTERWNAGFAWSNDSKQLAMVRGYTGGFQGVRMVAIPADGSGPGIEMQYSGDVEGSCCSAWAWEPDDSAILGTTTDAYGNRSAQVLWDPATGESKPTPWDSHSYPSHQRLAP